MNMYEVVSTKNCDQAAIYLFIQSKYTDTNKTTHGEKGLFTVRSTGTE